MTIDLLVQAMRGAAVLLACWNLTWAWRGFHDLSRGRVFTESLKEAAIFWFSATAISFQIAHLFGVTQLWRVASYSMLIPALALAAIAHHRARHPRVKALGGIIDHLPEALAITELARVDPIAAARQRDECNRLTVAAVMTKRGDARDG